MKTWHRLLGNERGVALPLAMILLMVLTMLTLTFMTLGSVEPQISRNLSDGARARQVSESGIEWAYNQLAGKTFDSLLGSTSPTPTAAPGACGTGLSCVVICPTGVACTTAGSGTQTLPGLTSASGTFIVTMRNDQIAADQGLIGAGNSVDGAANLDGNNVVILKSTGSFNGASRTITAVIERGKLLFNAAVNLPGDQGDTFIDTPPSSTAWSIDGQDWKDADTTSPTGVAPLKYGIAASTTGIEADIEGAFNTSGKRAFVQGKNETGGSTVTTGYNTMQTDNTLTPSMINDFMANLAANPQTQIIDSTQACAYPAGGGDRNKPEGLRMTSTGTANVVNVTNNASACPGSTNVNQTVNLGSASSPKMLYIKGQYDPDSLFRGLVVEGSNPITGYGILVIEDSDLAFLQSGNFRWNGIVLVTGRNNSTAFLSNSNTEIRGALVVNETNPLEPCCFYEFYASSTGSMKLRASKENVDRALLALYNMRISAYREN